jgi:hypothetical protein
LSSSFRKFNPFCAAQRCVCLVFIRRVEEVHKIQTDTG